MITFGIDYSHIIDEDFIRKRGSLNSISGTEYGLMNKKTFGEIIYLKDECILLFTLFDFFGKILRGR